MKPCFRMPPVGPCRALPLKLPHTPMIGLKYLANGVSGHQESVGCVSRLEGAKESDLRWLVALDHCHCHCLLLRGRHIDMPPCNYLLLLGVYQ